MLRPLFALAVGSALAAGSSMVPVDAHAQQSGAKGGTKTEGRRDEKREEKRAAELRSERREAATAAWRDYDRELGRLQRELNALQIAQGEIVNADARRRIDSAVRRLQPEMVRAERALIRAQERAQVQDRASFERTTLQALRRSATAQTQLRVEMAPMLRRMSEDLTGVQEQLPALVQQQKPRGWIGITMTGASEMRLTSEGRVLRHTEYPVVESVEPGSPAEKEGVETGDTIIAFNGRDVRAHDVALDRMLDVNATLRMTIRRGRRTRTIVMKVQRRPEQRSVYFLTDSADGGRAVFVMPRPAATAFGGTVRVGAYAPVPAMPPSPPAVASPAPRPALPPAAAMVPQPPSVVAYSFGYGAATFAGASVMTMDDDLRSTLDVDGGLLVVRVAPGTPAAEAGLRSGDVLRAVDGSQLSTPGMFQRALERASDREVKLLIVRKRKEQTMMMRW